MSSPLINTSLQTEYQENQPLNHTDERINLLQYKIEDRGTSSTFKTSIVLFKSYIGSGLMGMPYAFSKGGFWPGIATLVFVAFISSYCVRLLFKVKQELRKNYSEQNLSTFGEISEKILGKPGNYITNICIIFTQAGFSTAYLIFIGQNLFYLFPLFKSWEWVFIVCPFFFLISLIRRFKYLAPFGGLANVIILGAVGVVMWYCFSYELNEKSITWPFVNDVKFSTLPIFFGIAVYTFEGIGLVIDMEKSMKNPENFQPCLWIVSIFLVILFSGLGATGYFSFQENTSNIILLNLPVNKIYTKVIILGMMGALIATYPVQMFPVFSISENAFFNLHTPYLEIKRTILRFGIVLLTVGVANGIPHFGLFLSLIGSVGCSSLAFIIPSILFLGCFKKTISKIQLICVLTIIIFGIIASIITATITIIDIINISK